MNYVPPLVPHWQSQAAFQASQQARDTHRAATAAGETSEKMEVLVEAMERSIEISEQVSREAREASVFTRRIAWWSIGVAALSLVTMIVTLVATISG